MMNATTTERDYARKITLRDGGVIRVRHLEQSDCEALAEFFLDIPQHERFYLRDDVTNPDVCQEWTQNMDHSRAIPIVAVADDEIIAEGAVVARKGKARSHVAEIRFAVVPTWRNRGVGSELIRSLCEVASHAGFSAVLLELVAFGQDDAIAAAEEMGFIQIGRLEGGACDPQGHLHDLVTFSMPLADFWKERCDAVPHSDPVPITLGDSGVRR
jgi:L-amino acid N-acyltransferase YncA